MFPEQTDSSVVETIKHCLRSKFSNYKPETKNMPFHYRLLGRDRMALFSFIQSLNTSFGTSIYEPVAKEIAKANFKETRSQYRFGETITEAAQTEIQNIINDLSVGGDVDKGKEIERIRRVAREGRGKRLRSVKADLFLVSNEDEVFMFDLKTVKPNKAEFISYKRTLLEWLAVYLHQNPAAKINTAIAIPYNPYEPNPYARWTMKGMLDLEREVMIAEEFWDFLGGKGTLEILLSCFEKAGKEMRGEIDSYFAQFQRLDAPASPVEDDR